VEYSIENGRIFLPTESVDITAIFQSLKDSGDVFKLPPEFQRMLLELMGAGIVK